MKKHTCAWVYVNGLYIAACSGTKQPRYLKLGQTICSCGRQIQVVERATS